MRSKSLGSQGFSVEFMADLIYPVILAVNIGLDKLVIAAIEALSGKERIILRLINAKKFFTLFVTNFYALFLEKHGYLIIFIFVKACLQPYLQIPEILIIFDLLAKERDNLLQSFSLDDIVRTLQSLLSFLHSFISSLPNALFINIRLSLLMNSGVVRTALIVIGILIESIRRELIEAIVFILLNFILYPNGFD